MIERDEIDLDAPYERLRDRDEREHNEVKSEASVAPAWRTERRRPTYDELAEFKKRGGRL